MKTFVNAAAASDSGVGHGAGTDQRGRAEARAEPAVHDDPGGDVQPALAHRLPARWTHAHHREGRPGLAGDQQGAKTPVANVPAVLYQGQGGMLGVFVSPHYATDHNVYLTYAEPGDGGSSLALARARLAIGEGTASLEGLQVLWRQMPKGKGGQFGAADRLFSRRPVSVPDGRRAPAHDARPGSESGAGQDPAPDARRQAGAGQSDGRQDRRGERAADRSAARHGSGQDRARGQHLHVPRTEPDARGDLDHRSPHALRPGVRARRPAVGSRARPAEAATS